MTYRLASLGVLAACRDDLRIPLNASQRADRSGPYPYWGANSVQDRIDGFTVEGPTVLLGEDGAPFLDPLKPVAFYVDERIWPNNHIHVLKPTPAVEGRWLAYALNAVDYSPFVKGSTRQKLNQADMMMIRLPFPSTLALQRRIADYLDRETAEIDVMDAELDRLVETLEDRRTKMVLDAFDLHGGPGVRNAALQSLARFVAGSGFPLSDQGRAGLEIPFYKVNALGRSGPDGVIAFRDHSISRETADRLRAEVVRAGASVIAKIGAALMLGRVRMLGQEACIDNNMLALVPTKAIEDRFLFWFLHTVDMNQVVNPSTIPFLNERALRAIRVPLPPLSEQRKIVARLDEQTAQVDDMVADAQRLKSLLAERRSTLITDVVTGKKEVPA